MLTLNMEIYKKKLWKVKNKISSSMFLTSIRVSFVDDKVNVRRPQDIEN